MAPLQPHDPALTKLLATLDQVAETQVVWKEGLLNPGGPHRRLKGHMLPISIGEDECRAFGRVIQEFRPKNCFIVGNAFGLSSAYIAEAMRLCGGESVISLDNQSEGSGQLCAGVAQRLASAMGLADILKNKKGSSPQDLASAVEAPSYDLIFIDGMHAHPQVTKDLLGLVPFAHERTVFAFHDSWVRGVPEAVDHAKTLGYRNLWLPTSCEIILATKHPESYARLVKAFPEGVEDKKRRSYAVGAWITLREVVSYQVSALFGAA